MKCVFCAEEIQDSAILCRFCGAEKKDGQWLRPASLPTVAVRRKGSWTIRIAGGFFALSAVYMLINLTSDVPLFGAMRGGAVAVSYNLVYVALYGALAVGLMTARPWGFNLLLITTIIYTLDKVAFLLDSNAQQAYLTASGVTAEVSGLIDTSFIREAVILATLGSMISWWGFVVYAYFRREYFEARS